MDINTEHPHQQRQQKGIRIFILAMVIGVLVILGVNFFRQTITSGPCANIHGTQSIYEVDRTIKEWMNYPESYKRTSMHTQNTRGRKHFINVSYSGRSSIDGRPARFTANVVLDADTCKAEVPDGPRRI